MMTWDRASEIGRLGGCGLVALAIIKRRGGTPLVRYRNDTATHAAVLLDGVIVHFGDRDTGFCEVSVDELRRVCREDFAPEDVNLQHGEIKRVLELMNLWNNE
jgi:hypothetical protein